MSSEKKVCVVTGAAGGIGTAIVKKFYDNGYDVVMLDVAVEKLQKNMVDGILALCAVYRPFQIMV